MPDKLDYKKEYKDIYLPPKKPVIIDVPQINYIMVDGKGAPEGEEYQAAMSVMYSISFTIKMSKMNGMQPDGYFDYVTPPLEGLWGGKNGFDITRRDTWEWTSMIRLPEFVTPDVFKWAVASVREKKPEVKVEKARFEAFKEGLCVQIMHIGPYAREPESVALMHKFMEENGLADMTGPVRRHHEIYLGDPRKTKPENLRTVLRLPVERVR